MPGDISENQTSVGIIFLHFERFVSFISKTKISSRSIYISSDLYPRERGGVRYFLLLNCDKLIALNDGHA